MDDPTNIRRVFGENLQKLIPTKGSVASVALDLGLNRTQLNRYIRSEAFPRPDVLSQICDYFGVDARIFNTPLLSENKRVILPSGNPVIQPSTDVLPDGIYVEWTGSPDKTDRKFLHLIQISRCDGLCRVHLYARPLDVFEMKNTRRITVRHRELLRECVGFAFSHGHCIGMIDGLKGRGTMAFTTYFEGHFGNMDLFLGSKTTGLNNRGANNYNNRPCVLQKIPQTTASVLEWARSPQVFDAEDVPLGITAAFNHMLRFRSQAQAILDELHNTAFRETEYCIWLDFRLKSVSFGTNPDSFGAIAAHLAPSNDLSNHVLGVKIGSSCFSEFAR